MLCAMNVLHNTWWPLFTHVQNVQLIFFFCLFDWTSKLYPLHSKVIFLIAKTNVIVLQQFFWDQGCAGTCTPTYMHSVNQQSLISQVSSLIFIGGQYPLMPFSNSWKWWKNIIFQIITGWNGKCDSIRNVFQGVEILPVRAWSRKTNYLDGVPCMFKQAAFGTRGRKYETI